MKLSTERQDTTQIRVITVSYGKSKGNMIADRIVEYGSDQLWFGGNAIPNGLLIANSGPTNKFGLLITTQLYHYE